MLFKFFLYKAAEHQDETVSEHLNEETLSFFQAIFERHESIYLLMQSLNIFKHLF